MEHTYAQVVTISLALLRGWGIKSIPLHPSWIEATSTFEYHMLDVFGMEHNKRPPSNTMSITCLKWLPQAIYLKWISPKVNHVMRTMVSN